MSGGVFEIKTESIDIKEEWQIDLNHPNAKKGNEINDETKGHFAPEDLNFVKCKPEEEFIDSQNKMEEDPLEVGIQTKNTCNVCKKSYIHKTDLSRHIEAVHTRIKFV